MRVTKVDTERKAKQEEKTESDGEKSRVYVCAYVCYGHAFTASAEREFVEAGKAICGHTRISSTLSLTSFPTDVH